MNWRELVPSEDGTHHRRGGAPAYSERFDQVLSFHEPGLAPVSRSGASWHILPTGEAAYARRFRRAFGFYEGLASVESEEGWHHITPDGREVYAERYAWCGNFQEGRCPVRDAEGRYQHLDPAGGQRGTRPWRYAGDFRDGVAVVQREDGGSSHVTLDGELLHDRWFEDLDVFHKGYARARDGYGWHHVDRAARALYPRRFAMVEPFYNGQARVERFDGGLEVIDPEGTTRVELRPTPHAGALDGRVLARTAWGRVHLVESPGELPRIVKWTRGSNDREVEALLALKGRPGVPSLLGRHRHDMNDQLWLEVCAGRAVGQPRRLPVFPESEAIRITVDVLRVCEEMHARGWVHTDIHPGNVLDGDPATLLDYACAVRATYDRPWRGEINWGVWEYLPPEQLADRGELDPSADVYSAASLCLAMVSGAPPVRVALRAHFDAGGWPSVRAAILAEGPSAALGALREPLRRALSPAFAVDRRARPGARALAEALSHV